MASGGDYTAEIDANSVEKHQVADVNQGHVSAYAAAPAQMWSLTTHAGAPLQTLQHTTYGSTENGYHSSSGYRYDQPSETTMPREAPNKANTTSHPPAGVGEHGTQDYSAYASYPYSSASYGYSNTEYSNQYYGYQQPANASSQQYQQLANPPPSQHYQQTLNDSSHQYQQPATAVSQQYQQPTNAASQQYQQLTNAASQQYQQPTNAASQQYQQPANASAHQYQQPGNTPSQQYHHQPETQQYQQPASAPSHLQVGAGQTTGAPYQPLTSFQNASSFEGPTSYSGTYYNHGDYQTSGYQTTGYQNSGFSNQTNNWSDNNGGSYPPYDYSSYSQSSSGSTHNTNNATGNPQYQQQYNQWSGYYGQTTSTNPLCAPGTETTPSTGHTTVENAKQIPHGGYHYANNQPPPPGTTAWRQELASPGVSKSQGKDDNVGYNQTNNWSSQEHDFSNGDKTTPYLQKPLSSSQFSHANADRQQTTIHSHSSNLQFPLTNQISQNFQTHSHTTSTQDPCQTSKIQIPTNPRIAANVVINTPKFNNNTVSVTSASAMKPAYISVGAPNLHNKVASHGSAESAVMGALPLSLRSYVERAFSRCKDDSQRAANQKIMKEMITQASADGTLLTRNWDVEPLFPLELDAGDNNVQNYSSVPTLTKPRKSPSRRTKSRWEPLPEEKLAEKLQFVDHTSTKNIAWNSIGNKKAAPLMQADGANYVRKENGWNKMKFVPAQQQPLSTNTVTRPLKKQKFTDSSITKNGDASSDSDKEQNLTKYYSSAITLASTPEERKKRENRSKRFEKGQDRSSESKSFKTKSAGAGNMYTRRTNALFLAKKHDDITNRAVEDIDWDSLTVKGTCQEIEKRYLRLTSAPDPATVRPEEVLERALLMVQSSQKNYLYKCDQLKSIRQDLTVQRIRNELTVKVYETHARLAIEAGDMAEYNQCQSQLKNLYSDGIRGCHLEFSAYSLLCVILHSTNNRELLSSMARLSSKAREDEAVKHALAVRSAVTSGNYILFFRLYKKAPNLNTCFMDLYVEKMRFGAVKCMCKSYRPSVAVAYIAQVLGFSKVFLPEDNKETERLEGCDEWLRAHGAVLIASDTGEMQLDTKASSSTLFMPEPEDAVSHGDATLAVDDFFTRTS